MSFKKKHAYFLIFLFFFIRVISYSQDFETLYNYNKNKNYFVFREKIKSYSNSKNPWQAVFLNAIGDNVFGKFEESNVKLKLILDNFSSDIPDTILKDIYEIKASNHINLFEYKKAYESALKLNSEFIGYLDYNENDELENELIIWHALQNVPPQKKIKYGKISVPLKKDEAGIWKLPVSIKNKTYEFIFDTGANFCVITESLARKLNFEIIENAKFKVSTSTDIKVEAKIAISKQIKIGSAVFENVIFIVLPNEALDFGYYKIEGIIGNPVLKAFGEIIISGNNELIVPEQIEKNDLKNLAFDGFTPVVQVVCENDSLNFIFDTGGQETYLYNPFFLKYEKKISGKYNPVKIRIGGAGGIINVNGYILDKVIIISANSRVELKGIKLISDKLHDNNEYFHGHIGQDFFREFSIIKINYSDMYIEFIK